VTGPVIIESPQPSTLHEVLAFLLEAREITFPQLAGTPTPTDLAAFEQTYFQGQGRLQVARDHGRLVGVIGYLPYDRRFPALPYPGLKVVEVVRLFVLPAYRRAGVAQQLFSTLQAQAVVDGVQLLYLHTHPFLPGAVRFWQRQRFEVTLVEPDPQWQTTHMQRALVSSG
jgi:GNAT superfamily N-acetyltransferase